jgi:cell division protein FtsQ
VTRPAVQRATTRRGDRRSTGGRPGARRPRRVAAPRPRLPEIYRRRRRIAALVAAAVLLAGLGVAAHLLLHHSGLAEVETVEVTGALTVAVPDVRAAAAVEPGTPLAAVDTADVSARVGALPGVAAVDVGRSWPSTLRIAVTERVPVAVTRTSRGLVLVDATGLPYQAATGTPALPLLTFPGAGPDDASTAAAIEVLAALPEPVRAEVLTVDVAPGAVRQVSLGLTGQRRVRFGSAERVPEKAAVLAALLDQPGTVYDVTSPELPTVRP